MYLRAALGGRAMRTVATGALLLSVSLLSGACVMVPPLDVPVNVSVNNVVKRVKCDLVRAVRAKALENPKFRFLSQWTSKVRLTIVVEDNGSIHPGVSVTEPLRLAAETFTIGIGGGLSTQATRTVDIEFYLSFPEMIAEFAGLARQPDLAAARYDSCKFEDGVLLESNLDLKAVLDKALDPVAHGVLYPGRHPGGGAPPIPSNEFTAYRSTLRNLSSISMPGIITVEVARARNPAAATTFRNIEELMEIQKGSADAAQLNAIEQKKRQDLNDAAQNVEKAAKLAANAKSIVGDVIGPLFDVANAMMAKSCLGTLVETKYHATAQAAIVAFKKTDVDTANSVEASNAALAEQQKAFDATVTFARDFVEKATVCARVPVEAVPGRPAIYDPINVIGETINFNVTLSGSVTPSWRLVRVTAPVSSPFLSASRKTTNTLIIAMGRPSPDAGSPGSPAIDNQVLYSILNQSSHLPR